MDAETGETEQGLELVNKMTVYLFAGFLVYAIFNSGMRLTNEQTKKLSVLCDHGTCFLACISTIYECFRKNSRSGPTVW